MEAIQNISYDPLSLVLSRLKGYKRNGEGYIAPCPSHDDKKPSLNVSKGEDGKVLLKCFAGCDVKNIVSELGLSISDLFPQNNGHRQIVTTYDYCGEQGILLYQKVRYPRKKFSQRKPDGKGDWLYKLGDSRRVLYRLPELLQGNGLVIYVEGEKEVETAEALGFTATTAGSVNDWRKEFAHYFAGRELVVIPDNDEPGFELAQRVAKDCNEAGARVRILNLPNLPVHGDLSDWIEQGGDIAALLELIEQTGYFDVTPKPEKDTEAPDTVCLASIESEEIVWLWEPYIPFSKVTLLEGDPGVGKSFLTCAGGILKRCVNKEQAV